MPVEEIKNAVKNALIKADENIVFHFDEIKYTDFPFAFLELKDFKMESGGAYDKKFCNFKFEITYMKSKNNKPIELFEAQKLLGESILPVIEIRGKKLTPDNVSFRLSDKKLIMNFELNFYIYENDENETMQNIDISIKEDKHA